MEDRGLKLNRPLLSVRTRHSPHAISAKDDDEEDDGRRISNSIITSQISNRRSELKPNPVRNPGVVPFQWEQSPGKPKEIVARNKIEIRIEDEQKMSFESVNDDGGGGEEDHEAYVDALDTLSRAESSFSNCSFSSLTVLENSAVKLKSPSEISSRDPQTLDLVMGRFLPAAKAMALQCEAAAAAAPQYSKNPPKNPMDDAKKTMVVRKGKPLLRYGPSFANRYAHYSGNARFCSKGSTGIISSVPRTRVQKSIRLSPSQRYVRRHGGLRDDKDDHSIGVSKHRAHHLLLMDSSSEESSKEVERVSTSPMNRNTKAADSQISDKAHCSDFVISPPLPKSPSDSWLWRTLPAVVSTKNTSRAFMAGAETGAATKWEAIVKSLSDVCMDNISSPNPISRWCSSSRKLQFFLILSSILGLIIITFFHLIVIFVKNRPEMERKS